MEAYVGGGTVSISPPNGKGNCNIHVLHIAVALVEARHFDPEKDTYVFSK
jgi:hypothetical protein